MFMWAAFRGLNQEGQNLAEGGSLATVEGN